MATRFLVSSFWITLVFAIAPHQVAHTIHRLQSTVDPECLNWLLGSGGQFFQCATTLQPPSSNISTNCMINSTELDTFCNDACYPTIISGFDYIGSTGTCLNIFNSNAGCTLENCNSSTSVCYQGQCYATCSTTAQCQAMSQFQCTPDVKCWGPSGMQSFCTSNTTTSLNDGLINFYTNAYAYQALCVKEPTTNMYCSLNVSNHPQNVSSWTCNDVASWGCCLGTLLNMYTDCYHEVVNAPNLYNCPNSNLTCAGIPLAKDYCLPLCNGDDLAPTLGMTANCSSNFTYHLNNQCEQTCLNTTYKVHSGSLARTCQSSGYFTANNAVCSLGGASSLRPTLGVGFFILFSIFRLFS